MSIIPPYEPNRQPQRKELSGLGVASFVLGTIALMFTWFPIFGCFLIPVAILGVVLGIPAVVIAMRDSRVGRGFPVAGLCISTLALLVCILVNLAFAGALNAAAMRAQQQRQQQSPPTTMPEQPYTLPR